MYSLKKIRDNLELVNSIDWDMTNEKAIGRYLEWGGSWFEKKEYPVRDSFDSSTYFIINNWDKEPILYLIKRDHQETKELAKIRLPKRFRKEFLKYNRGIHSIEGKIKEWLKEELN